MRTAGNESSGAGGALRTVRIIWGAMVMGMLMFGAVVVFVNVSGAGADGSGEVESSGAAEAVSMVDVSRVETLIALVAGGLLVVTFPMGLFVRGQVFKRGWEGDVVTAAAYQTGNLILWALIEGPTVMAWVSVLIGERLLPGAAVGAAGIVAMLAVWPNGRAMTAGGMGRDANPYRYRGE